MRRDGFRHQAGGTAAGRRALQLVRGMGWLLAVAALASLASGCGGGGSGVIARMALVAIAHLLPPIRPAVASAAVYVVPDGAAAPAAGPLMTDADLLGTLGGIAIFIVVGAGQIALRAAMARLAAQTDELLAPARKPSANPMQSGSRR